MNLRLHVVSYSNNRNVTNEEIHQTLRNSYSLNIALPKPEGISFLPKQSQFFQRSIVVYLKLVRLWLQIISFSSMKSMCHGG